MTEDELLRRTAEARQNAAFATFQQDFADYGMLLGTMNPLELAEEIGKVFQAPKQAALMATLLARIITLEEALVHMGGRE